MILSGNPSGTERIIAHYSLVVPDGYTMKDVSPPRMDFSIFEIKNNKVNAHSLKLYLGNSPNFPAYTWNVNEKKGVRGDCVYEYYPYDHLAERLEGLMYFKNLTYRQNSSTPFSRIHYFTDGKVSPEEARVFEKIIDSIKVVKRDLN